MKIAFAGTPIFAAQALQAILVAGYEVPLVLSQPDRPAGRGMSLQASAVKLMAQAHGIPVHQPNTLRDAQQQTPLAACTPDILVVAAYGLILPQSVLDLPRLGCVNIHASLLPRWRGAAPIQRAIEAGDTETGITIMQMDQGLDTGPILLMRTLPISANETGGSLHDKLADLGAQTIVEALRAIDKAQLKPQPQPISGATYATKIEKAEAALDFQRPAIELARKIRAFNPFPGCTATVGGNTIKIWNAFAIAGNGAPGEILDIDNHNGIVIGTGTDALCLTELQKPGGKRMGIRDFLHGFPLKKGDHFDLKNSHLNL